MPTQVPAPAAPLPPLQILTISNADMTVEQQIELCKYALDFAVKGGGRVSFALFTSESGVVPALKWPPDAPPPAPPPAPKKYVRVKANASLNVRAAPINGTVIGGAHQSDGWLAVIGEQAGWYKVKWQEKEGWVSATYVEVQNV